MSIRVSDWENNTEPFGNSDFEENFEIIDNQKNIVNDAGSPYGNSFIRITEEEFEALKNGKLLFYDDGEYGTFIKFIGDNS